MEELIPLQLGGVLGHSPLGCVVVKGDRRVKSQAVEGSGLWSEGTFSCEKRQILKVGQLHFLLTMDIKERQGTQLFSCTPLPAPGLPFFLSSLTHGVEADLRLMGADVVEKPSVQNVLSLKPPRIYTVTCNWETSERGAYNHQMKCHLEEGVTLRKRKWVDLESRISNTQVFPWIMKRRNVFKSGSSF